MKRLSTSKAAVITCALALGAFASSASVFAQTPHRVRVDVPFDFQDGTKTLPAGIYTIDMPDEHVMHLSDATSKTNELTLTMADERKAAKQHSTVVFHRYGNRYFLNEVWIAGETTGYRVPATRAEKSMQIAENPETPTGTEVALNALPF